MKTVNMQAAKTQLSRLVDEALSGEEIILAKAGKPKVILTPYYRREGERKGGQLSALIGTIPPDFDYPDKRIEKMFGA